MKKIQSLLLFSALIAGATRASDFSKALSVRVVTCSNVPPELPTLPRVTLRLVGTREGVEVAYTTSVGQQDPESFDSTAPLNLASEGGYYLQMVDNGRLNLLLHAKDPATYLKLAQNNFQDGERFSFNGSLWIAGSPETTVYCFGVFNKQ